MGLIRYGKLVLLILLHIKLHGLKLFILQKPEPPLAGAFKERSTGVTSFRKFYERGDFPIALEHDTKGNKIAWKVKQCMISFLLSLLKSVHQIGLSQSGEHRTHIQEI